MNSTATLRYIRFKQYQTIQYIISHTSFHLPFQLSPSCIYGQINFALPSKYMTVHIST